MQHLPPTDRCPSYVAVMADSRSVSSGVADLTSACIAVFSVLEDAEEC